MQQATPFTRIAADSSDFFDDEYIPRDLAIKSLWSMKQHQLFTFFRHVSACEQTHGIQNTFRFKSVLSGRKKASLLPVQYVASAGAGGTSMVATTQPEAQQETVVPETSGGAGGSSIVPNTSQSEGAGAGGTPLNTSQPEGASASGTPLGATTQPEKEPETVDPLRSEPVQRSRVVPRLRGPAMPGPATVGPAPASSSRLQTSDLLALEEAKQWEVSGKRRRQ